MLRASIFVFECFVFDTTLQVSQSLGKEVKLSGKQSHVPAHKRKNAAISPPNVIIT